MKNKLSLEGNNKIVINQPPSEPCDGTTPTRNYPANPLPQIATIQGDNTAIAPPASNIDGDRCDEMNGTENMSGDL